MFMNTGPFIFSYKYLSFTCFGLAHSRHNLYVCAFLSMCTCTLAAICIGRPNVVRGTRSADCGIERKAIKYKHGIILPLAESASHHKVDFTTVNSFCVVPVPVT